LVNDTFGHAEGDRVLQTTALALSKAIRQTDTAARLGGDEFALLLPEANAQGAERVIDDLSSALQKAFAVSSLDLSCSIGVVTFLQPGVSMTQAIAAADSLMYEVKRKGKGAVAFRVVEGPARERADEEQAAGQ
jgi:diguanylate cyclase (GGDEF)-like protein